MKRFLVMLVVFFSFAIGAQADVYTIDGKGRIVYPGWFYTVHKVGYPDLHIGPFKYIPNPRAAGGAHGKRICNDDLGSCLYAHPRSCGLGGDCTPSGPGWAWYYGATCSDDCAQMTDVPLFKQGYYAIHDTGSELLPIRYKNLTACKKANPGKNLSPPRLSLCFPIGNLPNFEGLKF